MEIQLVCHGMMLFWYREAGQGRPDGYSILVPQSPPGEHEVRLGMGAGAPNSVIGYSDPLMGTQYFDLMFGAKISQKPRGKKPRETNLLMYRNANAAAVPNVGPAGNSGVAFVIDIPYPIREEAVRATTYAENPYLEGTTVAAFGVRPRRIVGTTVFTFEVDDAARFITLQNREKPEDVRVLQNAPITATSKIHLYCQSPTDPISDPGHLDMLNNLLLLNGQPLDLALNPGRTRDIDPAGLPIPAGLSFRDLLSLGELHTLYPLGASGDGTVRPRGIDPAECGQGGGC